VSRALLHLASMNSEPSKHPKARPDVAFRQVGDEWVLYDPVSHKLHVLNLVASLVWTHLDGTVQVREIAALIQEDFSDVAIDTVRKDVIDATALFESEGLLEK